jgi:tRNA U34 2-thiouridine synthase MnmA/TrmU
MTNVNWFLPYDFDNPKFLMVKVRYFHDGEKALLKRSAISGEFLVKLEQNVFAITRGQAAVFYDNDIVVCSGIIK